MQPIRAVLARALTAEPEQRAMEQGLIEILFGHGLDVMVVPDLYHSTSASPWVLASRQTQEALLVFSWLKPRAAFWSLQALGVIGRDVMEHFTSEGGADGRSILCLDMADQCCAPKWAEPLAQIVPRGTPGAGEITRYEDAVEERWYPVIDYERCTGCMKCMEFCLFGVFDRVHGRLQAAHPHLCKPGCPACSRVCPAQAIMFPEHTEDAVIAGAREGTIQPFDPGQVEEVREAVGRGAMSLRDVIRACACKGECQVKGKAQACSTQPAQGDAQYFGNLLDGLETLGE